MYETLLKRPFDFIVAFLALLLLFPLIIFIAFVVRIQIGSPVLFKQQRPGLFGKPFTMNKFRTMTNARHKNGDLLPDEDRLLPLGKFLRSTSLDELPELINVLRGDMSLVGPRPLMMQYLERYTPDQSRRHEVRPGITGWAQINGRNAVSWKERFEMDVWYVDHVSMWLDFKILLMTVAKVLKREGISADGHVTMTEFMGEN